MLLNDYMGLSSFCSCCRKNFTKRYLLTCPNARWWLCSMFNYTQQLEKKKISVTLSWFQIRKTKELCDIIDQIWTTLLTFYIDKLALNVLTIQIERNNLLFPLSLTILNSVSITWAIKNLRRSSEGCSFVCSFLKHFRFLV